MDKWSIRMNLKNKKIKVRWYLCTKASENNKLFTVDTLYTVTDEKMLNSRCVKTNVHKIFTDANHWFEFSDTSLNGLGDELNIFGGNILEKSEIGEEVIGRRKNKMVEYKDLW